jgi:hypothetical protein
MDIDKLQISAVSRAFAIYCRLDGNISEKDTSALKPLCSRYYNRNL